LEDLSPLGVPCVPPRGDLLAIAQASSAKTGSEVQFADPDTRRRYRYLPGHVVESLLAERLLPRAAYLTDRLVSSAARPFGDGRHHQLQFRQMLETANRDNDSAMDVPARSLSAASSSTVTSFLF
jgi:hypothetical protein